MFARSVPEFFTDFSPLQQVADGLGLALARDEFLIVRESDEPALAAQGAHLLNVVDVDKGVAMDAAEAGLMEPLGQNFEGVGGHEAALAGDDPDDIALGLKRGDVGGV